MSALSDVFPASFRKVPFFVRRTITSGGRRTTTHEFVNSTFREVEDLGVDLKRFNLTAFVTSQSDADRLIEALDKKDSAVLSHPFYGDHVVRQVAPYSVDNDMSRLGEITFELSFAIKLDKFVSKNPSTLDSIRNKAQEVSDNLGLDVAKEYFSSGLAAINATADFVNEAADKIDSISELYSQAITTVSTLVSSVQGIKNSIVNLTNLPNRMATDLNRLLDNFVNIFEEKKTVTPDISPSLSESQQDILGNTDDVVSDVEKTEKEEKQILENETVSALDITGSDINKALFESLEKLYDFNKDSTRVGQIVSASSVDLNGNDAGGTSAASIDIGNAITREESEIIVNEKTLTRMFRIGSLSRSYIAATEVEYTSVDEIEEIQGKLESQYQSVITDLDIPRGTLTSLRELRDIAERFFFDEKITVNQVINIDVNPIPAQVLAFSLHGNTDLARIMISLNDEIDVSHMSGNKKVLTA